MSLGDIEKSLTPCKFGRIESYPQNPSVSKYSPGLHGKAISHDVFYHEPASSPALLIVCAFAKFIFARFVNSMKPMSLISVVLNNWTCLFGMPESIACDRGAHFMGSEWNTLCDTHSVKMIMDLTGSHYQVGTAERQVELVKRSYAKVSMTVAASYSKHDKLALVCTAMNITPSSTSAWSPLVLVSGRSDHVTGLLNDGPLIICA